MAITKIFNKIKEYVILRRKSIGEVAFTGMNQAWKIVAGPLILILIPTYLTPELQGYWFTIIGLSVLMIFADMGFANIILQFSAHEFAHLKLNKTGEIEGDPVRVKRLSSLFIFAVKWALTATLIVGPIVAGISYLMLSRGHSTVDWFVPWIIYLAGSMITFMNNALISFFEGCDQISVGQRIRLFIGVINTIIMLSMLVMGYGLFSLAISAITSAIIGTAVTIFRFRPMIMSILPKSSSVKFNWGKEIFPLLFKYAVTWGSGYFIFQFYTPIMFYFHGAVEAGKVGLSIALWMAIYNISNSWVLSAIPKMNMHVSRKEHSWLNSTFRNRLILSLISYLLGAVAFALFYVYIGNIIGINGRLSGIVPLIMLGICWMMQIIVNALGTYMRAFREEPLALPSFASAIYIIILTLVFAKYYPPDYIFIGFFTSYFWALPWIIYLFLRQKMYFLIIKNEFRDDSR